MKQIVKSKLAVEGGEPVRTEPMPPRRLMGKEERAAAMKVFDECIKTGNTFLYNGNFEQQYEKDFCEYMGGGYADGVNSGTNALFCAIGALQLDAFSEIIVPPITDPGGVMPVIFTGCVPVFADSDPRSYNICAKEIEKLITKRTKAVIVAHIGGEPVDMDPIMELARKHKLYVIEDCAQAHGARYKGRLVGTIGHIAAFSTMGGKHHSTGGQGGVVYTRSEKLHWQGKRFADRGKPFNIKNARGNVVAGINCNLNDLSAAIGSAQIKKLPKIVARRKYIGETVKECLKKECHAVFVGWQVPDTECSYWFLRIGLDLRLLKVNKETFCKALIAEGIPVAVSYRHIPGEAPWVKKQATFGKSKFPWNCKDYKGSHKPITHFPNAIGVTNTHFNIPIHENYTDREIEDILTAIKKVELAYLK